MKFRSSSRRDPRGLLGLWVDPEPRGSKYPSFKVPGPKHRTLNDIWGQGSQILGTWTLQGRSIHLWVVIITWRLTMYFLLVMTCFFSRDCNIWSTKEQHRVSV